MRLTQGSPPALASRPHRRCQKTDPQRRSRGGEGAEGGRSTGSTYDPGPEKPGNRSEEKTPGTGEGWHEMSESEEDPPFMTVNTHPRNALRCFAPPLPGGLVDVRQGVGSRGRKTMVATPASRFSVRIGKTWKREGVKDTRIPLSGGIPTRASREGQQRPGRNGCLKGRSAPGNRGWESTAT
jgi:hypothetical protein